MKFKRKLFLVYVLPALIIHELSHIFFLIIFFKYFRVKNIHIDKNTQHYDVTLRIPPLSIFMCFCVSYAPFFSMIFFLLFGFTYNWMWIVFIYQVTAGEVSLPSYADIQIMQETYDFETDMKKTRNNNKSII